MQKRSHLYQSKDPFVFYFSPNIEVETKVVAGKKDNKMIKIGFFKEGKDSQIGAGVWIYDDGELHQSYFKDNKREYYGRSFYENGDFYIGGFKQHKWHGKGEVQWQNGRRLVGIWEEGRKEGHFKHYDKNQVEEDRLYKDDKIIQN